MVCCIFIGYTHPAPSLRGGYGFVVCHSPSLWEPVPLISGRLNHYQMLFPLWERGLGGVYIFPTTVIAKSSFSIYQNLGLNLRAMLCFLFPVNLGMSQMVNNYFCTILLKGIECKIDYIQKINILHGLTWRLCLSGQSFLKKRHWFIYYYLIIWVIYILHHITSP